MRVLLHMSLSDALHCTDARLYSEAKFRNTARVLKRYSCDLVDAFDEDRSEFYKLMYFLLGMSEDSERCLWRDVQDSILEWRSLLKEQGLDFTHLNAVVTIDGFSCSKMIGPLTDLVHREEPGSLQDMRRVANVIFLMCLFEIGLSIETSPYGFQPLHFLMILPKSPEISKFWADIAYILVHFGHADVSAKTALELTPTMVALQFGWFEEWVGVLEQCGIDVITIIAQDLTCCAKHKRLGSGESSVIDTEDIWVTVGSSAWENMRQRRTFGRNVVDE